jgi:hypothetical protein
MADVSGATIGIAGASLTATWEPNQNALIFGRAFSPIPGFARLAASADPEGRAIITEPKLTLHSEMLFNVQMNACPSRTRLLELAEDLHSSHNGVR